MTYQYYHSPEHLVEFDVTKQAFDKIKKNNIVVAVTARGKLDRDYWLENFILILFKIYFY